MAVTTFIQDLTKSIQSLHNPSSAVMRTKYMKGVVQSLGLTSPQLADLIKSKKSQFVAFIDPPYGKSTIYDIVEQFMTSNIHEHKLAAIGIMQHTFTKANKPCRNDLDFLGKRIFDKNLAFDWATVDTLCGRLIHEILINDGNHSDTDAARDLLEWSKETDKTWKVRASCVAFVKLARHGNHNQIIHEIASNAIQSNERFAQLGCGWMLRELWLADPQLVVNFIQSNYSKFSREGLRYAIEKMDQSLQQKILNYDTEKSEKITVKNSKKRSLESSKNQKKSKSMDIDSENDDFEESQPKRKKAKRG